MALEEKLGERSSSKKYLPMAKYHQKSTYKTLAKDDEIKISEGQLIAGMIVSGIGTAVFGAWLFYEMFPDTFNDIIKYFF